MSATKDLLAKVCALSLLTAGILRERGELVPDRLLVELAKRHEELFELVTEHVFTQDV